MTRDGRHRVDDDLDAHLYRDFLDSTRSTDRLEDFSDGGARREWSWLWTAIVAITLSGLGLIAWAISKM